MRIDGIHTASNARARTIDKGLPSLQESLAEMASASLPSGCMAGDRSHGGHGGKAARCNGIGAADSTASIAAALAAANRDAVEDGGDSDASSQLSADNGDGRDGSLANAAPLSAGIPDASGFHQEGNASWYGQGFHGQRTASGERYDMNELTAAHRSLPLMSYARVTNLGNHKFVIVKINDRGPFHGRRILDLSMAAAAALGMEHKGTGHVAIIGLSPSEARQALREPMLASR
jgi:rare lipoprotein A